MKFAIKKASDRWDSKPEIKEVATLDDLKKIAKEYLNDENRMSEDQEYIDIVVDFNIYKHLGNLPVITIRDDYLD